MIFFTAKCVADDISNATTIASAIADAAEDPRTTAAIRTEVDVINALAPDLINSTKAAIAEPNNVQAAAALHRFVVIIPSPFSPL